jgi:6-phospho-3-hexuloisomerase
MKASSTQHDERLGFSRPARQFRAKTAVHPDKAMTIATPTTLPALAIAALGDLARVFERLPPEAAAPLVDALVAARRIALYGAGREGLMIKGLAMRLFHLGLDAHVVADMTVPPVGEGDLLLVSSGPGNSNIANALIEVAREAGARTAAVTAQPDGPTPKAADIVFLIPAQTRADDRGGAVSVLPMGSLFETAEMIAFELVVLALRERLGETAETMRARHTNLE